MRPTDMIREWLEARRDQKYKQASEAVSEHYKASLNAVAYICAKGEITEEEMNKRMQELQKEANEKEDALLAASEVAPRITDVPAIRATLEVLAWAALVAAVAFILHPTWVDRNIGETLVIAGVAGLAGAYLRNTWKRGSN